MARISTYGWIFTGALLTLCTSATASAATGRTLTNEFRDFDINNDGIDEIDYINPYGFGDADVNLPASAKVILVFVDEYLKNLSSTSGTYTKDDFHGRMSQLRGDLIADGYTPIFFSTRVYRGQKHQDGRTLLAMRRVLQRAKSLFPKFQGTLLVGAFPEAMLVRRWVWKRDNGEVTIAGTKYNCKQGTCPSAEYVRIVPELISHRADLVLADLNGKWENLYVEPKTDLESIEAIPVGGLSKVTNGAVITSTKFNVTKETFEDFFWIKDDRYEILENGQTLKMRVYTGLQHPETANVDKSRKNPIAHPDIFVARINAKNVSHFPDKNFKDRRGKGFLDANGQPQILYTSKPIKPEAYLRRNVTFERDLLVEYFDRNHAFRVGGNPQAARRTAAVSHGDGLESAGSMNNYLRKASSNFNGSLATDDADLREYVAFLKQPAVLKGVVAHSSPWSSKFGTSYSTSGLTGDVGKP